MTERDLISFAEFERLRLELAPNGSDSWLQVPWHISLTQAVSAAARENKPLAMIVRSGHPLGCTCNNGLVERASVTGNPEIATMLATRFITVAIDQHIHRRLRDSEGRLFADLVKRAGQRLDVTAQGFYVFTGSGEPLGYTHLQDPTIVKQILNSAVAETYSKPSASEWNEPCADADFALKAPPGIIVLDVVSKVLGGYGEPSNNREQTLQSSYGRDHCWLREDEAVSLSRSILPDSLLRRMARFHLVDNTRGEPPKWRDDQIHTAKAVLSDGRLVGSVRLRSAHQRRGYEASLFGVVESDGGLITQFDVVARGLAWGRGFHNGGAPSGKYPMAVRFTLAKPAWPFDAIPPGAARTRVDEYLGMSTTESRK